MAQMDGTHQTGWIPSLFLRRKGNKGLGSHVIPSRKVHGKAQVRMKNCVAKGCGL